MRIKFSQLLLVLLVALPVFAMGIGDREAYEMLKGAKSKAEINKILESRKDWSEKVNANKSQLKSGRTPTEFLETARRDSLLDPSPVQTTKGKPTNSPADIIKNNRIDTSPSGKESNIGSKAFKSLGEYLTNLLPKPQRSSGSDASGLQIIGTLLQFLMYSVLGVLILGCLYLIFKLIMGISLRKRSKESKIEIGELMSEVEANIPLDEWLSRGEKLIAEGKYREAIRCYYLAMLLRMGEANLVKIVRNQTNWEHLKRYQSNPNRLRDFDFHTQTMYFDQVWYGNSVAEISLATQFQSDYTSLLTSIKDQLI